MEKRTEETIWEQELGVFQTLSLQRKICRLIFLYLFIFFKRKRKASSWKWKLGRDPYMGHLPRRDQRHNKKQFKLSCSPLDPGDKKEHSCWELYWGARRGGWQAEQEGEDNIYPAGKWLSLVLCTCELDSVCSLTSATEEMTETKRGEGLFTQHLCMRYCGGNVRRK